MAHKKSINCRACDHFYITWERPHPFGCRAMGFKSPQMPSLIVLKNSGRPCLQFKEKTPKKPPCPPKGIIA